MTLLRLACVSTLLAMSIVDAHAVATGCACSREEVLENIRTAETVFRGRVVKANMPSLDTDRIDLTLEIVDPIRGKSAGKIQVSTTLSRQCSVGATIGAHALFVIRNDDQLLTQCSGSALPYGDGWHHLIYALVTIAYVESDPEIVRRWLGRSFSSKL